MTYYTAYYRSSIGPLEINSTEKSIVSVLFVTSERDTNSACPEVISRCITQLDEYFKGERRTFELPLFPDGTDFQMSVWNELKKIPYGKVISYLELAKRLGNSKSIRAAGTASGKNKIGIIIPCHRVIGSSGELVGYAGGLKNKQWLLEHEARYAIGVQKLF